MDRFIDTVMMASDRVDERVRLLARLGDTVAPLVGDLGPDTRYLLRRAVLGSVRMGHEGPLDLLADVLDRLTDAIGVETSWRTADLTPGESLALGMCDGHGLTTHAVSAVLGAEHDAVAGARDRARLAVHLPPAPPACTRRHADTGVSEDECVACVLVRADARSARARILAHRALPSGPVMQRVVQAAEAWQAEILRPRLRHVAGGPSPWTGEAGLTA